MSDVTVGLPQRRKRLHHCLGALPGMAARVPGVPACPDLLATVHFCQCIQINSLLQQADSQQAADDHHKKRVATLVTVQTDHCQHKNQQRANMMQGRSRH